MTEPVTGPGTPGVPLPASSPLPASPPLLALDGLLFPAPPKYTGLELAAAAGIDIEVAERLWRAMGFTTVPRDEPLFLEDDLEALRVAAQAMEQGASLDDVVYQTRVTAASLARVAEVTSDVMVDQIGQLRAAGLDESQIAELLRGSEAASFDRLLAYFYRRQLKAALWRKLAGLDQSAEKAALTVAFVDLVRFTAMTEDIADEQLGQLIDRFEATAHERVTAHGGRVVKMIGDEVMFVADDPGAALDAALDLVEVFDREPSVPPARAGLAEGPVLAHGGDYFGPVVNLAARIVDVARPRTVVASGALHDRLRSRPDVTWRRLPPKRLKGIGRSPLWVVTRSTASSS